MPWDEFLGWLEYMRLKSEEEREAIEAARNR